MNNYLEFRDAKCRDCYKCLRECPVKAIEIVNHHAQIVDKRCILCGKCTSVCPQNAKFVHNERTSIEELLNSDAEVIASVAPSFASSFNINDFGFMKIALKKLGFSDVVETAQAASLVTKEYERILNGKTFKNFITSCCPAVNRMIQLYYPKALKYLAPVDSPMVAHGKMIKKTHPNAVVIFIGPCIAKKREAEESGIIDGVLTFEDLDIMLKEKNIDVAKIAPLMKSSESVEYNKAKYYPISRGIIKSFSGYPDGYECVSVDGVKRCVEVLENIESLSGMMIEMNSCEYSCVNGPCKLEVVGGAVKANGDIRNYAQKGISAPSEHKAFVGTEFKSGIEKEISNSLDDYDFITMHKRIRTDENIPSESEILEILKMTGKNCKEDELNCGACGYNSCREKAWAVANKFAELDMCVPFMRQRAESMSYEIIQNSPNGIVLLDNEFRITEINAKAIELWGIKDKNIKGKQAFDYFNPADFILASQKGVNQFRKKELIEKTNKYVEMTIVILKNQNVLFGVMKDITTEVNSNEKLNKVRMETVNITDEVIKKQMRVAQEIASLLGETTAETKVALVNLKKQLLKTDEAGE